MGMSSFTLVTMGLFSRSHKDSSLTPKTGLSGTKSLPLHGSSGKKSQIPPLPNKVFIKQVAIKSMDDFSKFQASLQAGNIIVVDFEAVARQSEMKSNPHFSLQSQLAWLKQYCLKSGGSASKLREYVFLVTPNRSFHINH